MTGPLLAAAFSTLAVLGVHVEPARPRLGDTLAVIVSGTGGPVTVTAEGRSYPAFPISDERQRAFVPLSPLGRPRRLQIAVTGGDQKKTVGVAVGDRRFAVQRIRTRRPPTELDPVERARVNDAKALATRERRWSGTFQAPAGGRTSSPYGVKRYRNGIFLRDYYHRGIDYAPGEGAPVVAPAGGTVALVGRENAGFPVHGNMVGLDHGHGVVSFFLHLSRVLVAEGDAVQPGQRLGLVGATGTVTGPHLHWGLYVNGVAVDPVPWLQRPVE